MNQCSKQIPNHSKLSCALDAKEKTKRKIHKKPAGIQGGDVGAAQDVGDIMTADDTMVPKRRLVGKHQNPSTCPTLKKPESVKKKISL